MNQKYIDRQVEALKQMSAALSADTSGCLPRDVSFETLAMLVLAARVETLEDALIDGLPTAGEGI